MDTSKVNQVKTDMNGTLLSTGDVVITSRAIFQSRRGIVQKVQPWANMVCLIEQGGSIEASVVPSTVQKTENTTS